MKANRFVVIETSRGITSGVLPFESFEDAKAVADTKAERLNPQDDDIVVWDLMIDANVYNPFKALGIEF